MIVHTKPQLLRIIVPRFMYANKPAILAGMDYNTLASADVVAKTIEGLKARGVEAFSIANKADALEKIKELIPAGASVMNGSSRTLEEIGYVEYLKSSTHGWNNLHAAIIAEEDPAKQAALRQQAVFSDFYLGSVHAIAQSGEMVIASATGSQLPALTFTAKNIILVVGTQKIVPTLADAMSRLETYVFPLEDKRMKDAGKGGSLLAKILIFVHEHEKMGRKVHVLLVNEHLGY